MVVLWDSVRTGRHERKDENGGDIWMRICR